MGARYWVVLCVGLWWCLPLGEAAAVPWPDLSAPAVQGGGEQDAAVIVGIEDYAFVPDVPGAVRNANDWVTWMTRARGVEASRVTLLRDRAATRERILRGVEAAARQVGPGGTLWVVFIGHGAPDKGGEGVLIGYDAQRAADSLSGRGVRRSALIKAAMDKPERRAVIVLDACFSGSAGDAGPLVPGLQPLVPVRDAFSPPPGVVVLSAAKADQFAGPLPGAKRPAFSYLLLGGLRGWADKDKDGAVKASEALAYTRGTLRAVVRDRTQTPLMSGADRILSKGDEAGPDLTRMLLVRRDASGDRVVRRVPDTKALSALGSLKGHEEAVNAVVHDPKGQWMATAGEEKEIRVWDLRRGRLDRVLKGHGGAILSLAVSPDGRWMASGDDDGEVWLWRVEGFERARKLKPRRDVRALAFSPDGAWLASGGNSDEVAVWSVGTWKRVRTIKAHKGNIHALVFGPGGRWLASASRDKTIAITSLKGETLRVLTHHTDKVLALAVSPDGQWLASAGADQSIAMWDATDFGVSRVLRGHSASIGALRFTEDSAGLFSGDESGTLRLWDPATGAQRRHVRAHSKGIAGLGSTPGGGTVVSVGGDAQVVVVASETGAVLGRIGRR